MPSVDTPTKTDRTADSKIILSFQKKMKFTPIIITIFENENKDINTHIRFSWV